MLDWWGGAEKGDEGGVRGEGDKPASQRRRQGSLRDFHFCQTVWKGEDIAGVCGGGETTCLREEELKPL